MKKDHKSSRARPKKNPTSEARDYFPQRTVALLIGVGLIVATLAVYGQIVSHQFINLDDDKYVYGNSMVVSGLTFKGIAWAFTTFLSGNWHPLTWLSLMLDVQLFGVKPGAHLAVNLLFHILNSLLVFALLKEITPVQQSESKTGREQPARHLWLSGIVAALFALHPMHVESVAWVAERKDVLSSFFALLCLMAYGRYARAGSTTWARFMPVILFLALALMTKSMFVTWPFVMLLLDYWPLNRLQWHPGDRLEQMASRLAPLVREKIPLFVLIGASTVMAYTAQADAGALTQLGAAPLSLRISNAVVSYVKYIALLIWPTGLGVFYPFPPVAFWQTAGALVLLTGVTVMAVRSTQKRRYLIVGWAWFLGTLVPVIGLVKLGSQSMADRYSYLPSIGLFLMIVWGIADFVPRNGGRAISIRIGAVMWLAVIGVLSWIQVGYWKDSITLYKHSLSAGTPSILVHYNLAQALASQGNRDEAVTHFNEVLRINPTFMDGLISMGIVLTEQQKFAEAVPYLNEAIRVDPNSSRAQLQLGIALVESGRVDEALPHLYRVLELTPNDSTVRSRLGVLLLRNNKLAEAKQQFSEVVRQNPNSAEAHHNLGLTLLMQGKPGEGAEEFSTALRLKPDFRSAQDNLNAARKLQKIAGQP